jgi:hypothetical protein
MLGSVSCPVSVYRRPPPPELKKPADQGQKD